MYLKLHLHIFNLKYTGKLKKKKTHTHKQKTIGNIFNPFEVA